MDNLHRATARHAPLAQGDASGGVALGSRILTLDGALPIEHLYPGDRIITRAGVRRLERIRRLNLPEGAPIITLKCDALGGRPDRDLWVLPEQKLRVSDWRAKAIWGKPVAYVAASRLIDDTYVRADVAKAATAVLQLEFETPQIIYADGLELLSDAQMVACD